MSWRNRGMGIAGEIVSRRDDWTEGELRKALSDGYPWGERKMHPYRIWLSVSKEMVDQHFPKKPSGEDTKGLPMFD